VQIDIVSFSGCHTRISCRWQTRATGCITANRKRSDSVSTC